MSRGIRIVWGIALAISFVAGVASAGDWPHWRGPNRNGVSPESGLISTWDLGGENLIWRDDWTGRSTPVAVSGRVCANGRRGTGIERQEAVACWDARTGSKLWEKRFNVFHTTVPWNRVGWANPTADPDTGYLYIQGVGGLFTVLDSADGSIVWQKNLIEEYGFMEGYGGRTQTPILDEGRVIVTFSSTSWGTLGKPLHRLYAFDKLTGDGIWVSTPADSQADKNTQTTPFVTVIDGRRTLIQGNASGKIVAVEARTGRPLWTFQLSKRGINTSVVVDGTTVYAAHSEENIDGPDMGRVVAIDATGWGDVTATHELWRADVSSGFTSPTLADGRLYVIDNSANLHALDPKTGASLWEHDLGTVGRGSSVVAADGKLYVGEVNGKFHILEPGPEGAKTLDTEQINMPEGRYAEMWGSPAVAYGRIYFTTEEGIYCLGDPEAAFDAGTASKYEVAEEAPSEDAERVTLLVLPASVELRPGESVEFRVEAFDDKGRSLGEVGADWALGGLSGKVEGGRFTASADTSFQTGTVEAHRAALTGAARVRVVADLPFEEDFESFEPGSRPPYLLGYTSRFVVGELEDTTKAMSKGHSPVKIHRHHTMIGRVEDSDYTIQADLFGTRTGRKVPDMGLVNSGYILDLMGGHKKLEIRSWTSELRMADSVPFDTQQGIWYTMKLRVEVVDGKGLIRGKVWPRDGEEPEEWTLSVEDPLPIENGSPGLYGYSPSPIYYDNVKVWSNQ